MGDILAVWFANVFIYYSGGLKEKRKREVAFVQCKNRTESSHLVEDNCRLHMCNVVYF